MNPWHVLLYVIYFCPFSLFTTVKASSSTFPKTRDTPTRKCITSLIICNAPQWGLTPFLKESTPNNSGQWHHVFTWSYLINIIDSNVVLQQHQYYTQISQCVDYIDPRGDDFMWTFIAHKPIINNMDHRVTTQRSLNFRMILHQLADILGYASLQ